MTECRNCGATLGPTHNFCPQCGDAVQPAHQPQDSPGQPEQSTARRGVDLSNLDFYPQYGLFKIPVEAVLFFLILDPIASSVSRFSSDGPLGLVSALVLWIAVLGWIYALYEVHAELPARSIDPTDQDNGQVDPGADLEVGGGMAIVGGILTVAAWNPVQRHAEAWLTRVYMGPGSGVPPNSSSGDLGLAILGVIVGLELLSRGVDRLLTLWWRKRVLRRHRHEGREPVV